MAYTFRTLTTEQKRQHLSAQLLQAEYDLFVHTTNAELCTVAGKAEEAAALEALAATAQEVAETTGALLDALPPAEVLDED
jgi:hypothetical protein